MSDSASETETGDGRERLVVYSDYACPFCYLGPKSLAEYRAERDDLLDIEWHPHDLRGNERGPDGEIDDSVEDGKDEAYKDETYFDRVRENVARLHEEYDAGEMLWVDGRDVGDPEVLADVVASVGLPAGVAREALDDESTRERPFDRFAAARQDDVTGVPAFVDDDHAARGAVPPAHRRRLVEGV